MKVNEYIPNLKFFNEMNIGKSSNFIKSEENNISFISTLKSKLDEVNQKQIQTENTTEEFIKGDKDIPIHKVMLDSEEAKMSLELAVQVRNKLVEAYQELNRMQL